MNILLYLYLLQMPLMVCFILKTFLLPTPCPFQLLFSELVSCQASGRQLTWKKASVFLGRHQKTPVCKHTVCVLLLQGNGLIAATAGAGYSDRFPTGESLFPL